MPSRRDPSTAPPRRPRERPLRRIALLALLSLAVHLIVAPLLTRGFTTGADAPLRVTVLPDDVPLPDLPVAPEPPSVPPVDPGPPPRPRQIVDIAAPAVQQRPKDADYLAEFDRTVPEETRTETTRVNPEVVAERVSATTKEARVEPAGGDTPQPEAGVDLDRGRSGPVLSRIPARFRMDDRAGRAATAGAAGDPQAAEGAPQNDLLDERLGEAVALNSLAYAGARYFNGIRGRINFYWTQNVDNLPRYGRLLHPTVKTRVRVVLDGAGAVEAMGLVSSSGDARVDACVTRAFRDAGPFPDPPAELIASDGRVHLPDFVFTIQEILGAR
jgi:TonB family protein